MGSDAPPQRTRSVILWGRVASEFLTGPAPARPRPTGSATRPARPYTALRAAASLEKKAGRSAKEGEEKSASDSEVSRQMRLIEVILHLPLLPWLARRWALCPSLTSMPQVLKEALPLLRGSTPPGLT